MVRQTIPGHVPGALIGHVVLECDFHKVARHFVSTALIIFFAAFVAGHICFL